MTAVNLNRAVRGPVTAVPVVAGKGVRIVADTVNNRFVVEADETVLFENASGSASTAFPITLSETIQNFERVKFYWRAWPDGTANADTVTECMTDITNYTLTTFYVNNATSSNIDPYNIVAVLGSSGTTLSTLYGYVSAWRNTTVTSTLSGFKLYKVVGINRKAST